MRISALLLLFVVVAVPVDAGANRVTDGLPLADPAPTGESGLIARVLFSSNVLGEFEPCSCPDIPLGGVGQLVAQVEAARATGVPAFWLDSGNRLFRLDMAMTGTEEAERRLRAILLVDAGSVGGLDAMGVGRLDLGGGLDYLRALAKRAAFPMLSANLFDADGELIFEPSVLLQRGDLVVGVTSVLPADMHPAGSSTSDPYGAAKREVRALRKQGADLVVVLSNLGMEADAKLGRVSKADLVLGSQSRELTVEGVRAGKAVIGQAGARGRYLGDARWYSEGDGRGPHLVVTTAPVHSTGVVHPAVGALVGSTLERLADPVLGVPPMEFDSWDDPEFRERQRR